jgi:hypothetical protein
MGHDTVLGDVLLVGSLPYTTVEEALQGGAQLGDDVTSLPDGEVGDRRYWTTYLAIATYSQHPDLVETRKPTRFEPLPDDEGLPGTDRAFHWTFALAPGVETLEFPELHYAEAALESYKIFLRLREEGTIAEGRRFQVSIPSTSSAVDQFFDQHEQWPVIHDAYIRAVGREIERILETIPADDLAIQFDLAWEVNDLSLGDERYFDFWPQTTYDEKMSRHTDLLVALTAQVPEDVVMGLHWCYGTWGGWPMTDMPNLQLCVDLSNNVVPRAGRHVDYVHMPVTLSPPAGFFDPLRELEIGDTKVYLGLIHHEDGIEGCRRRIEQAREALPSFGVAAVCGYGREDPADLGGVFELSRACAHAIHEV